MTPVDSLTPSQLSKNVLLGPKKAEFEGGTEGLRGFAALLVLYTHLIYPQPHVDPVYAPPNILRALDASQGGVLLFFILSGYVIGLTNRRALSWPNSKNYLWRRGLRLFPLYFLAIMVSWAVLPVDGWPAVLGNIFFLQGTFGVPGLVANSNLWSLNFEAIYYLLFFVIWWRPMLWWLWAGVAAVVGIGAGMSSGGIASVAPYASGWLYWVIGFGFSRAPKSESPPALPIFSILALWLFTWKVKPLALLLTLCGIPLESDSMWFGFYAYDFLISSLVMLMAASERRLSFTKLLIFGSFAIPVLWTLYRISQGQFFQGKETFYDVLVLSAFALIRVKPKFNIFMPLAWFGSISYAVYIFQRPVQYFIRDASWLPTGSVAAYLLRVCLIIVIVVCVSWWLEKRLQPKIRQWVTRDKKI